MEFCVLPPDIKCKEWPCPWCCPSDQSSIYLRRQTVWLQVTLCYMSTLLWGGCQLRLSLLTYEVQRMCWCKSSLLHYLSVTCSTYVTDATFRPSRVVPGTQSLCACWSPLLVKCYISVTCWSTPLSKDTFFLAIDYMLSKHARDDADSAAVGDHCKCTLPQLCTTHRTN